MQEGRLDVAELLGVVAALAEIGILIDGAGDEAGNGGGFFLIGAEDVGEACGECGGGLNSGEDHFADVITGTVRWGFCCGRALFTCRRNQRFL